MDKKFKRKSKKINEKKYLITEKYIHKLCDTEKQLDDKIIKKHLKSYARKMANLEMKKYGFFRLLKIEELKSNKNAGFQHGIFKEGSIIRTNPIMSINYNKCINNMKEADKNDKRGVFIKFVQSVHHELGHLEQQVAIEKGGKLEDISSVDALKYAIESAKCDIEQENKKDYYREITEENARQKGLNAVLDIFKGKKEYKDNINQMIKNKLEMTTNEYLLDLEEYDENGVVSDRTTRNTKVIDESYYGYRKTFLKEYPILKKMYNMDGSRKSMYQLAMDFETQKEKINNNQFLSRKKKDEKNNDTSDLYSEMFWNSLSQSDNKEIIFTKKMIGNEIFDSMLSMTKKYYIREHRKYKTLAKNKYLLSNQIYGEDTNNLDRYKDITKNINYKYNSIRQILSGIEDFSRDNPVEKMSNDEIKQKIREDRKKIKDVIKENYEFQKNDTKDINLTIYENISQNTNESNLDINLDSIRDMRDEYKDYQQLLIIEQEETKKEYYDLLEMEKSQKVINSNKEK